MRRLRGIFKRSSFFYSIFIPIAVIGTALITGFGFYTYNETYQKIQSNLIVDRQIYVNQVKGNLEQKIQTIEFLFTNYSNTNSFKELINQPLDHRNFMEVREVSSELAYFGVMGVNNATYQLISLSQGWEINNGSLNQLPDDEINELYSTIEKSNRYLTWTPEQNEMKMLMLLPTFSRERSAIGVANISKRSIDRLVQDSDDNFYMIFNQDDQILYTNNGEKLDNDLKKTIMTADDKEGFVKAENGDIYIYSQSDYNQWIYISRLSEDKVRSSVLDLEIGLVLIIALLLILFITITYIVSNTASQPMKKIRDLLAVDPSAVGRKAEIDQILLGIDTIVEENTDLSLKLNHQKPELENLFQLNLFRGRVSADELAEKLAQFDYQIADDERFVVMTIQIDDLGGREQSTIDIFLLAIENLVSELIPEKHRFRPIVLNQNTQATILRLTSAMNRKQIITYCESIQSAARQYLKIKISFGISDIYSDLTNSKLAVDNAKEALHFRINLGQESMIFFDEIVSHLDEKSVIKYPKEAEQELLDAMRSEEVSIVQSHFTKVFDLIVKENHNPLTIRNAILRLMNSIIQLGQLLGADYDVLQNSQNLYLEVLNKDNLFEIKELLLHGLIIPIVETIQNVTDREMKNLSDKVTVLVHKQYDQDISLESIADQLHYNSNYLSSVFKKEMGLNFADYLQNYRLMIAKEWLIQTKMTIKEISERLQYNNPQNFIRFFKKKEGLTPGEYRKQNKR